jgi:MSHA biogenesis protein MshO
MVNRRYSRGFNLPEVIMAIVIVGIIGGLMAPVIEQSIGSYFTTRTRGELTAKGRLALEQLARAVREAVPNSLEVVTLGGNEGVQFLSVRTGGRYVSTDDGFAGTFLVTTRRFAKSPNAMTELYILDALSLQSSDRLIIGNTSAGELRAGSTAVALTGVTATANVPDGTTVGQILQFGSHSFPNDSPGNHFVISNETHEIGLQGDTLRWRKSAGMSSYDTNGDWSSSDPVLVDGVTALDFSYEPGTPYASGVLRVDIELTDGDESIRLYQEIQIRNTP